MLELVDAFADDVWFIDLGPLHDHRLVAASVARALDVRESGGRSAHDLLIDALRGRLMLLVLDNVEHLLEAAQLHPGATSLPRITCCTGKRRTEYAANWAKPLSESTGRRVTAPTASPTSRASGHVTRRPTLILVQPLGLSDAGVVLT